MDSYMEPQFHPHNQHHHHHQDQPNSGWLRFRSAPSSLLSDFTQNLTSSENFVGRFGDEFSESSYERKPQRLNLNSQNGYSGLGSGRLPPQYPKPTMVSTTSSSNSSSIQTSRGVGGLNLNRQSSSPAGFFSHLNPQNGYTMTRGLGNFRVGNDTNDESSPHTSRLGMNHLPQIPEFGSENVKETNPEFSFASWSDSGSEVSHLSETGGLTTRPNVLSHHLSLPMTSSEMNAIEKGLHFQDMVPSFKVRAKRGCATHPRSIAERVRRNRISERMRKLQDLVPNMDKQTNTADMLDFAVEYIKDLQNQHKVLSDNRAKCKCINLKHSVTNQAI